MMRDKNSKENKEMTIKVNINSYNANPGGATLFSGWFKTLHGDDAEVPSLGAGTLGYAGKIVAIVWKYPDRSDWRGKVFRYTPDSDAIDEPFWVSGRSKGKVLQAAKFYHGIAYCKGGVAPTKESIVAW